MLPVTVPPASRAPRFQLTTSLEVQSGWDLRAERPVIAECRLGGGRAALPTEINFNNGLRASRLNLGVDDTRRLYAGLRAFGEVRVTTELLSVPPVCPSSRLTPHS